MLNVSDSAVKKFKDFINEQKLTGHGIRILAVPGGWRPSLTMDIVKDAIEGDVTLERDGLKVFLQNEAIMWFPNVTIDYSDETGFFLSGVDACSCS